MWAEVRALTLAVVVHPSSLSLARGLPGMKGEGISAGVGTLSPGFSLFQYVHNVLRSRVVLGSQVGYRWMGFFTSPPNLWVVGTRLRTHPWMGSYCGGK